MVPQKKSKWRIALRIVLGMVFLFLVLFADSLGLGRLLVPLTGDAMDWKSHYVAGFQSTNCGRVKVRQDPSQATACALKANSEGRAFRVVYNIQGYDSSVAGGIVRTSDGRVFALSFEGCPAGCGFSYLTQRASVQSCPTPYRLYTNPAGRLNCFQPQLAPPQGIMAPNAEPY